MRKSQDAENGMIIPRYQPPSDRKQRTIFGTGTNAKKERLVLSNIDHQPQTLAKSK